MKKSLILILVLLLGTVSILPLTAQEDSSEREPDWWESTVWYEIFVRSFYDSDGDGIGDIQGVIEKLDYLNDGDPTTTDDLGITGIWLMPIMEAASYHGYDTVDYRAVEQDYGTREDFLELMDAAHERGIRVIVDLVLNHTSDDHPWFEAAEQGDEEFLNWYVWEEENPGYTGPWGATAWYRNNENGLWYYAPFWSRMPDLNHENPAVTAEIYDIGRYWIEEMGADGFRLDAIRYLLEPEVEGRDVPILSDAPENRAYLRDFTDYIHSVDPDAYLVGEVLQPSTAVLSRYTDDDAIDAIFEFVIAEDIISTALLGNKRSIERHVETALEEYEPGEFATLTTNHDMDRLLTVLQGNVDQNRVAANLLLTLPGSPFIYYGEEIGMMGGKPDEFIRRPMQWDATPVTGGFTTGTPWQPLDENFAERTVLGQTDNPDSLLSHYRSLIHLRNNHPALQYGETILVESSLGAVWGYLRYTEEEALLVVLNLNDRESREYAFAIEESPFAEYTEAELIYGTTEAAVLPPDFDTNGGFAAYTTIAAPMPSNSIYVIRLR